MPNPRRRKFSVQTNLIDVSAKMARSSQTSDIDILNSEATSSRHNKSLPRRSRISNKISNSTKLSPSLETLTESDSEIFDSSDGQDIHDTTEKYVTATSSNLSLINTFTKNDDLPPYKMIEKQDKYKFKVEKYPRQHRMKVRNTNQFTSCSKIVNFTQSSVGINTPNWDIEEQIALDRATANADSITNNNSYDEMCRICHSGSITSTIGCMISACACRGTVGKVHVKCLEHWLTESGKSRCELCGTKYATVRVHKYGVLKALAMWLLSHNAKQILIDCLGIVLMSPMAVLAALLSGRTLAGLMKKDYDSAPWPLASTFVLACMTLVCYYCWIVSAVTRHALGWWIWYRSQYEVKLQFQNVQ